MKDQKDQKIIEIKLKKNQLVKLVLVQVLVLRWTFAFSITENNWLGRGINVQQV